MDEQVRSTKKAGCEAGFCFFNEASMLHLCFTHKGDTCYQITACCLTMLTVFAIPDERIN